MDPALFFAEGRSHNLMGEVRDNPPPASAPSPASCNEPPQPLSAPIYDPPPPETPPPPPPRFDASRMIGIIRRKALIKDLAAVYHAECLTYGQELLELQRKYEEPYIDIKVPDESRKETMRSSKRLKKSR